MNVCVYRNVCMFVCMCMYTHTHTLYISISLELQGGTIGMKVKSLPDVVSSLQLPCLLSVSWSLRKRVRVCKTGNIAHPYVIRGTSTSRSIKPYIQICISNFWVGSWFLTILTRVGLQCEGLIEG